MLDFEDVTFFSLVLSPLNLVIYLLIICIMLMIAMSNQQDCEKRRCVTGQARIIDGDCVCVELAK